MQTEGYFHSVTLDIEKCKGCINCIKRCPTEAIRVHDGKANIITQLCIDCGECIRVCPHRAKQAQTDRLEQKNRFAYTIALPAPSLYAQFGNVHEVEPILEAMQELGFDEVYEVAAAAELVSDATRRLLEQNKLKLPVISSACPAVVRLIRARFPSLIPHVLPLLAPVELAARIAKKQAARRTGLAEADIGTVFLSPCPAKVTAAKSPLGSEHSAVDLVVSMRDIYPALLASLSKKEERQPAAEQRSGRIGMSWAASGGEATGLVNVENYLAADGIENVIRVLEDLEDKKFGNLTFIELNACSGGCVGGVLTVENPYIAKARLKQMRKYRPMAVAHLPQGEEEGLLWEKQLLYAPVMELGDSRRESYARAARMEDIVKRLPGLDCGSCGAPTCRSLAEDIVRGTATERDCVVRLREEMERMLFHIGRKT